MTITLPDTEQDTHTHVDAFPWEEYEFTPATPCEVPWHERGTLDLPAEWLAIWKCATCSRTPVDFLVCESCLLLEGHLQCSACDVLVPWREGLVLVTKL